MGAPLAYEVWVDGLMVHADGSLKRAMRWASDFRHQDRTGAHVILRMPDRDIHLAPREDAEDGPEATITSPFEFDTREPQ